MSKPSSTTLYYKVLFQFYSVLHKTGFLNTSYTILLTNQTFFLKSIISQNGNLPQIGAKLTKIFKTTQIFSLGTLGAWDNTLQTISWISGYYAPPNAPGRLSLVGLSMFRSFKSNFRCIPPVLGRLESVSLASCWSVGHSWTPLVLIQVPLILTAFFPNNLAVSIGGF